MALVTVADADNEAEAMMIVSRLRDAGIPAMSKPTGPGGSAQFGSGATQSIYVDEADEAQARELLDAGDFTDDELAQLAEEAGREQGGAPPD
jgi:Putative prokaryotic signal transducing protein